MISEERINNLFELAFKRYSVDTYDQIISKIDENKDKIAFISSFAKDVILLAEDKNEIALSIIQHSTRVIADYIIELRDNLNYGNKNING